MVFNSFCFWLIFPFIFILYWAIPGTCNRLRNMLLLAVSYLLYMNYNPAFSLVLMGVTAVTFTGGAFLARLADGNIDVRRRRKILCACFAVLGLLPLLMFKYYDFFNDTVSILLEKCGMHFMLRGLNWAIPVGISFFTFQAVGYLLDVYHNRVQAEKRFLDYALFVSFFPQVTSGPISTAKELLPQFKKPHTFCYRQGVEGLQMLLWGMFLKCVVADRVGQYVDIVYSNYVHFSSLNCLLASICYTIQIYADFAGYSLMAVGIAKTLGFDLIQNFHRPYFAQSVTEFWRRWHISLTRWLTTHVYINLGGNRCPKPRQYMNIMVTFVVSGLWHGANWTFIVWGMIHGLLLMMEKMSGLDPKGKYSDRLRPLRPLRIVVTFFLVNFAWIFFRMPTLEDALGLIAQIFIGNASEGALAKMNNEVIFFTSVAVLSLSLVESRMEFLSGKMRWLDSKVCRWLLYIMAFCMILTIGVLDESSFIYMSF